MRCILTVISFSVGVVILGTMPMVAAAMDARTVKAKALHHQRYPKIHKIPNTMHSRDTFMRIEEGKELVALNLHYLKISLLRGGAADDPSRPAPSFDFNIDAATVASYTGGLLLAAMTVALVRKIPRSGGHGPAWFKHILPEPYATGALHLGYLLHCIVALKLMPLSLRDVVFSPTGVILIGTLFPVIESIRAAATDSGIDHRIWLMYWIMHGLFSYSTEFIDKWADKYPAVHRHWFSFEFYATLWLILPMTDGAAIIYELVTKPYLVPIVKPIKERCEGWLTTVALTLVNASYLWWFSVAFLALPNFIKRVAVIFTGTLFPVIASIVAVSTMADGADDMRWLTYWSCFSLLFLVMTTLEKLVGPFTGLYTVTLASTLYLMLPIFDGSIAVFRKILVPLFGQREALILKDARSLARQLIKQLPADRHGAARDAAAAAFLEEAGGKTV
jgi:TB2/DP1, HVA22 family